MAGWGRGGWGEGLEGRAECAGDSVGLPKGQWWWGVISANAGGCASADKLNTTLSESLRDSEGLIVTPSASCFGAFTIDAPEWGAQIEAGLRHRLRDSTPFPLHLPAEPPHPPPPAPYNPNVPSPPSPPPPTAPA